MSSDDADWWRSGLVDGACLINVSTGATLTLPAASTGVFGRSFFTRAPLFVATATNGLYDFAP